MQSRYSQQVRRSATGILAAQSGIGLAAFARRHREYRSAHTVVGQQTFEFRDCLVVQTVIRSGTEAADGIASQRHIADTAATVCHIGECGIPGAERADDAVQRDFVAAREAERRIAPNRNPYRRTTGTEVPAPHQPRRSERRPSANHRRFLETQRHHARFAVRRLYRSLHGHSQ